VIRAKDHALVTAVRVVKTAGHEVHAAVTADAGEDADFVVFATHDKERLATKIDADEVARIGDLGDVGEGDPFFFEDLIFLELSEGGIGVSGGGESGGELARFGGGFEDAGLGVEGFDGGGSDGGWDEGGHGVTFVGVPCSVFRC
jgi:hypothetical protein